MYCAVCAGSSALADVVLNWWTLLCPRMSWQLMALEQIPHGGETQVVYIYFNKAPGAGKNPKLLCPWVRYPCCPSSYLRPNHMFMIAYIYVDL